MADLKVTPEFKETFLSMLSCIPNITAVCKLVGIHPSTIDKHRTKDSEFDASIREHMEQGYDMIEEEARRRAVDGVLEPVFYMGEEIGAVRKYSDKLLSQLLKAYKPKKFNPGANIKVGDGEKVTMTFNLGGD